ncbi:MAG: MBL fold metallo-hydrolase [Burkholderiales bacterium]
MRFACVGSGSKGNCVVAEAGGTRVLLDCGLAPQEIERRLAPLGVEASSLRAILVTHEHDDHAGHAFAFAAAHGLTLFLTHGTRAALEESGKANRSAKVQVICSGREFAVDGLSVHPFTVPHDAREPVQFVISDGARRLGVLTDLGASTAHVESVLSGIDALVLECNHDLDMLWRSDYPRWLKQRIASPFGHLDNVASRRLLSALDRSRLQHVIAAHLSQQNNRPALARMALAQALACDESWIGVATQQEGFGWRELR